MSKYIVQYYSKTSTISKDKELSFLFSQLNATDENNKKSLKTILKNAIKNIIQKESGLYKHSKDIILERMVKNNSNKKMIEYIKKMEKKFLNGEITRTEFANIIFKKAKKEKNYISRTHFLMYLKKIQEEKLIDSIKNDPEKFLQYIKEKKAGKDINSFLNKWIGHKCLSNEKNNNCFNKKKNQIYYKTYSYDYDKNPFGHIFSNIDTKHHSQINRAIFFTNYVLKKHFFKKNKKKEYKNVKEFLFKIINSEPITDKDIEKWTNLDKAIKKMQNDEAIDFKNKETLERFKKRFITTFRKAVLSPLRESFLNELHQDKEKAKLIEKATSVMPYYKKLQEISQNFKKLDKNSVENVLCSSFNENHEFQFFNFNQKSVQETLNYIQEAKHFLVKNDNTDKEIAKALADFEKNIVKIKDKNKINKEEALTIKESYETLKEKLFLYRKEQNSLIDPLFKSFTNIRNAYKKTFFKSTSQMLDIYKQSGISDIKIMLDSFLASQESSPYLKFNPNSRMFEYYEEEDEGPKFSLPVSAVMNKERTAVKKNIYIKPIFSRNKRFHSKENEEKKNFLTVSNYEEINKTIQKNIYNFKNIFYNKKKNQLEKNKTDNPNL